MKACTVCKMLSSLLIITNPEESELARELNIQIPGEYCLRVR